MTETNDDSPPGAAEATREEAQTTETFIPYRELLRLRRRLERREAEKERLLEELERLQADIAGLLASRSWRLTAPLRSLADFVRAHPWLLWPARRLKAALAARKPPDPPAPVEPPEESPEAAVPPAAPPARRLAQGARPLPRRPRVRLLRPVSCRLKGEWPRRLPMHLEAIPRARYEEEARPEAQAAGEVKALAYYLPQFHAFPENDAWWGEGFTEWVNVRRARPFFEGHRQPAAPHPTVGYYTLGPEVLRKQAALARRHGIYGFCFHHYWFTGKRLMAMPVDSLLERPDIDLPFCLNWANENWTRRWDGHDDDVLIAQRYSPEDDAAFMGDLLRYFRDSRYIRIKGRPLLLVYKAQLLPEPAATVARWREACAAAGDQPPFLAMVQSYYPCKNPRDYGFDAVAQFPPHGVQNHVRVPGVHDDFSGEFLSYSGVMRSQTACWTRERTVFPGVMPAWDNTPRRMNKAAIVAGTSPEAYERSLVKACAFVRESYPPELRYVFINSWNEWAEGANIEPSAASGFTYLNATGRAVSRR
jgi:hypothetical protein